MIQRPGLSIPSFKAGLGVASKTELAAPDWKATRRAEALKSFWTFLPYWWWVNRETGQPMRFTSATMWRGQQELADLYQEEPWVFALKAGKLGFTQLEIAWDAYRGLTVPNGRVHLFSMNQQSSIYLLDYVKYGLLRLPDWFEVHIRSDLAGGENSQSLKVSVGADRLDVRTFTSYAAGDNVSIDQSCIHAHVDELARMDHPARTWAAVQSTVSPHDGTCHIVTRGQGEDDFVTSLWAAAAPENSDTLVGRSMNEGHVRLGKLVGYFAPFSYRDDREAGWRDIEGATMTPQELAWWAPEDPMDAFAGDASQIFIPMPWWDGCNDPYLQEHPLLLGDTTPLVLGVDAAISGDSFAIVAVSRHWEEEKWNSSIAVRATKIWRPADFGGRIDFDYIERYLWCVCRGGCAGTIGQYGMLQQHPLEEPSADCAACQEGRTVPPLNIICVAYDPHELEQMMQRLRRRRVAWFEEFNQGELRLQADKALYDLVALRRLAHNGDPLLREHIDNAKAKIPKDEDKKLRIIKKSPQRKIDAAVALSMAAWQCLFLNVPRAA